VAFYDRNVMLRELDSTAVDTIVALAGPQAEAPFIVELRHFGGAYSRPPIVPSAVGGRDAAFTLFSASDLVPDRLEEIRLAHDVLHQKMRPWSTGGVLLNFLGVDDVDPERVRTAFTPTDYARLTEVKAIHDPDNRFRINHNIPPAR
jgi:FAD/FMN-containing dehydrogenase